MSENNRLTNENGAAADVRSPVETACGYLSREARLVARVADPETRDVLEQLAAALRDPARVSAFIRRRPRRAAGRRRCQAVS